MKRIHFIAIGGSAMHNLALALHKLGNVVTGSDDAIFEPSKSRLESQGLMPVELGWFEDRITQDIDFIILGMHAKDDNPELIKAKSLGIKIYSYPEFIYEHSKDKTRVVIGGSHGKTTITSMILHVMKYHNINVDYMVGAQLEGFDTMVHLTNTNDFIILEGDEYLSSAIDRRPKFHLYKPNIALISGIAWDHINVFPTFENYVKQFEVFVNQITQGGILIYNEHDQEVKNIAENTENQIRKIPYQIAEHRIDDGITYLNTPEGDMPIEVFGTHNLSNLEGAKWVCQCIGVDEEDFYQAIASFKGASKRLEKIYQTDKKVVFKDFAHSPSKVKATAWAVKEQYPNRKVTAVLELHTYSSLTAEFLSEYKGVLNQVDEAIVFYSSEALHIKRMKEITPEQIKEGFQNNAIKVFTKPEDLEVYLSSIKSNLEVLLFMSSGNYGGLDILKVVR
ncbi:MAG: Mur ligase family protein [Bacteroidota bacterium]|nr:Mur ligase family protein [Bacteroidota bacterium]